MGVSGVLAALLARSVLGQAVKPRRRGGPPADPVAVSWDRRFRDPRSAVLLVVALVLLGGGGRKLRQTVHARRAVGRLEDADVSTTEIEAAAAHGRAGLMELFRLLAEGPSPAHRDAAGRALAALWARDELIAEEEKALVRRGYRVDWTARRRYPRALRGEIPVAAAFGVPFLVEGGEGVRPSQLEWSYRVVGSGRESLKEFGPWAAGPGRAAFTVVPADFDANGPHKLALVARVRTVGLTDAWDLELPHMPFSFEFDPILAVDALLALPDAARGDAIAAAVGLDGSRPDPSADPSGPSYLPLNRTLAIPYVPVLRVETPLPCDLAHAVELEFAGVDGWFPAGSVVLSGQGGEGAARTRRFPLGPVAAVPIDRPGVRAMRARLVPDPDLGWADPEVRSIWPGTIVTGWTEVEVARL